MYAVRVSHGYRSISAGAPDLSSKPASAAAAASVDRQEKCFKKLLQY